MYSSSLSDGMLQPHKFFDLNQQSRYIPFSDRAHLKYGGLHQKFWTTRLLMPRSRMGPHQKRCLMIAQLPSENAPATIRLSASNHPQNAISMGPSDCSRVPGSSANTIEVRGLNEVATGSMTRGINCWCRHRFSVPRSPSSGLACAPP